MIAAARETRLDAGKIHALTAAGETVADAMFFDSAGFGISARVLAARNADRKVVEQLGPIKELYRDHLVYAGALLRTFLESYVISDKFDATVTADGVVHQLTDLTELIIEGTRIYAGAWVFDRASCRLQRARRANQAAARARSSTRPPPRRRAFLFRTRASEPSKWS